MALSEFELIRQFFLGLGAKRDDVLLGIGDDAALVDVGGSEALVLCVDTLVAGVHFPENAPADAVGHKALAVNLSDLAAMGARPAWGMLALTLPTAQPDWLAGFRTGMHGLAERHGVGLIGGDTTRGALAASVTLIGFVEPELALRRDGARPGDGIYVSGALGDAAAGLRFWQAGRGGQSSEVVQLVERLHRPAPRVELGRGLRGIASAAIDISDGLAADLGHVLSRSGVGGRVVLEQLPLSSSLRQTCSGGEAAVFALSGGDDYELCFTVPAEQEAALEALQRRLNVPMTRIGVIEAEPGLRVVGPRGEPLPLAQAGFDHFFGG
jgi:thiamine-monophosphate kinase